MKTPNSSDIRKKRVKAGLTQVEAAEMLHTNERTWQRWEAGDCEMHAGLWELFSLKLRSENA